MALNKTQLVNDLTILLSNPSVTSNVNAVAVQLADAIDSYVKSGNAVGTDSRGDTHSLTLR